MKRWRWARRAGLMALCVLLCLNTSGCWSQRELNSLAIVLATAFDLGEKPDTLKLTAQVVKASAIKSAASGDGGSGGGVPQQAYVNIQYTDKSVLSLLRGLTHILSRRLYFPHNQVLIFSNDLAKLDMSEALDGFIRDYETRMNVYILVSRGKAADILDVPCDLELTPAIHLARLMENQKANSDTLVVTLRDFAIATLGGATAPMAPIIEITEEDGKQVVELDGTAVFKQGRMIGELSRMQTRGMMWVTGRADSGVMTVDTQWGQVVLEIMHTKGALKPVMGKDGTIRMQLKLEVDGYIQSNETMEDMTTPEKIQMLKGLATRSINADIADAQMQARTLQADIFGFGDLIYSDYPDAWDGVKDHWDKVFPDIDLNVEVDMKLRSTGGLTKPVVPGGAK